MEFHEKLQYLRKRNALTQEQLAEKLYVSRTAVSKWESGKGYPNIESLKCLSKEFHVSIDDLLSGNDLPDDEKTEPETAPDRRTVFLYAIPDMLSVLLPFLPLFGQRDGDSVHAVMLFAAADISLFLRVIFCAALTAMTVSGIAEVFIPHRNRPALLHAAVLLLFMIARQPYVSAILFATLFAKWFLLTRKITV